MASVEAKEDGAPTFVDIGANLLDPMFSGSYHGKKKHEGDLSAVLDRSWGAGLEYIMVTGTSLEDSIAAQKFVESDSRLYCTTGVHPTNSNEFGDDPKAHTEKLKEAIQAGVKAGKVVAVGECGLDFDRLQYCSKEVQLANFEPQIAIAEELDLPMFLHNRGTDGVFLDVMRKYKGRIKGVVHSFDGSAEEAAALIDLGLFIGLNGCSLKTKENLEVAKTIPLESLMIETDAPWCEIRATHAGKPHVVTDWPKKKAEKWSAGSLVKGRCEPCMIRQVAEVIAGIKGISWEEVARASSLNAKGMFKFPETAPAAI